MTTAFVLGGAACVWRDIEAARAICEPGGTVACNDIGAHWPGPLDAWTSLHADHFRAWTNRRAQLGHPPALRTVTVQDTDHLFPGQQTVGSSGLFALKVALVDLGFDKAVICGVPMSAEANHLRHPGEPWPDADPHWPGWLEALPQIAGRARSMSGRTRELLGAPTADWLR